jgi:hypothetical protein
MNCPILPVTFSCVNTCDIERRFSVFDESVHWQSIGKGSEGILSIGPTGPTHVVYLNRSKCHKSTSGFFVTSRTYDGIVTLNFVLARAAKGLRHRLPQREEKGLLLQSSVRVSAGSTVNVGHAIRITGHRYKIRVLSNSAGASLEKVLAPDIAMRRRVLLPTNRPCSLSDFAGFSQNQIAIVGAFVPLAAGESEDSSDILAVDFQLLAFNAAGRLLATGSYLPGYRVTKVDDQKYQQHIGLFKWTYYHDGYAVVVDLDGLLAQGVVSLAVLAVPPWGWDLTSFRRKAVRLVDVGSGNEIGLCHIAAPRRNSNWSMLVGGLVFKDGELLWIPGGDSVFGLDMGLHGQCWRERLRKWECLR